MKEKNGSVLYIPEHRCWEEKGKIRKRPHSTDSIPESKRLCANGTEGISPLPNSLDMVDVGYTKTSLKQHGEMTKVEPMVVYSPLGIRRAEAAAQNHVKDTMAHTDAQMDGLKKRLETTHSQLRVEKEAKKELSRTVAKLQNELGTVRAQLTDYRQRLEALQAFPSMSIFLALECVLWSCGVYCRAFQGPLEPLCCLVF